MFDSTVVRAHVSAAGAKGGRTATRRSLSRWVLDQDPPEDRLRGAAARLPPHRREVSDSRQFETLLNIGPDITPRAVMTDKGSDANVNREAARKHRICPVIPYRSNAKDRPAF
jgi:hypothetical protein